MRFQVAGMSAESLDSLPMDMPDNIEGSMLANVSEGKPKESIEKIP